MRIASFTLMMVLACTVEAYADVSDSGSLTIGGQAVIAGTMTVQGNSFSVGGSTLVVKQGAMGIGTMNPQSALHVPDGKYFQAEDNNAGAPPSADCDADAERGRISIDTTNNRLYICNGATRGWDYAALTD